MSINGIIVRKMNYTDIFITCNTTFWQFVIYTRYKVAKSLSTYVTRTSISMIYLNEKTPFLLMSCFIFNCATMLQGFMLATGWDDCTHKTFFMMAEVFLQHFAHQQITFYYTSSFKVTVYFLLFTMKQIFFVRVLKCATIYLIFCRVFRCKDVSTKATNHRLV